MNERLLRPFNYDTDCYASVFTSGVHYDATRPRIQVFSGTVGDVDIVLPYSPDVEDVRSEYASLELYKKENLPFEVAGEDPSFGINFTPIVDERSQETVDNFLSRLEPSLREEYKKKIIKTASPLCKYSSEGGLAFGSKDELYFFVSPQGKIGLNQVLVQPELSAEMEWHRASDRNLMYRFGVRESYLNFEFGSGGSVISGDNPASIRMYTGVVIHKSPFSDLGASVRGQIDGMFWDDTDALKAIQPYIRIENASE